MVVESIEESRAFGRLEGKMQATLDAIRRLDARMEKLETKYSRLMILVASIAGTLGLGGGILIP